MKLLIISFLFILFSVSIQAQDFSTADQELFFMPTAYTMPQGASYLNFPELFFINYSYAVTPSTHIGLFSIFPVIKDFTSFLTVGAKQNYLKLFPSASSDHIFQSALFTTYSPVAGLFTLGNVVSIGKYSHSLHLGLSFIKYKDYTPNAFFILIGYRIDPFKWLSLISEYTNVKSKVDMNFYGGLLTFGIRVRPGETTALEIAALKILTDSEKHILFPFIKMSIYFK